MRDQRNLLWFTALVFWGIVALFSASLIRNVEAFPDGKPSLVVVSPVAMNLHTHTRSEGIRLVFEVTGVDAEGCTRYAGSAEVLRTFTGSVYVYLLPLPVPICIMGTFP